MKKNHGTNEQRQGGPLVSVCSMQVQVVDQTAHPPKCHSFVGLDRQIGSSPPACLVENSWRQSVTHFDTCIQLHSVPRSKMVRERHGEKVSSLEG